MWGTELIKAGEYNGLTIGTSVPSKKADLCVIQMVIK